MQLNTSTKHAEGTKRKKRMQLSAPCDFTLKFKGCKALFQKVLDIFALEQKLPKEKTLIQLFSFEH